MNRTAIAYGVVLWAMAARFWHARWRDARWRSATRRDQSNRGVMTRHLCTTAGWFLAVGLTVTALAAPARASAIFNSPSAHPHTVDGLFTGWSAGAPTSTYEWFDITPLDGAYSKIYFDFDASADTLWIMNDWYANTTQTDMTEYNQFTETVRHANGTVDVWALKVFVDNHVEATLNGTPVSIAGVYGFDASPNEATPHTMWEIVLTDLRGDGPVSIGDDGTEIEWIEDGHCDPLNFVPHRPCATDPLNGHSKLTPAEDGTFKVVPEPPMALVTIFGTMSAAIRWRRRSSGGRGDR